MTSGITQDQLTRAADDVLRAPKAERWSTLHKFYAFDRPFILNELVDRFARSEAELTNARADARALRDALDTAQKAKENWPRNVEQIERLRAEVANERANANNLGVSLTRLQLQANGWKEENEQLRKERDQLRQELSKVQINLHDHVSGLAAVVKERDEAKVEVKCLVDMNEVLAKENERARSTIAEKDRLLDERAYRINELNLGIVRAQDVRQDRQTDAQLFLELIHLGRTVDDARAILAAANDIRKNGLTPKP